MTTISPDLSELKQVRLEELQQKKHPASFKKILGEKHPHPRRKQESDDSQENDHPCVISVFELPRNHFSLPEEDLDCTSGCQEVSPLPPAAALAAPSEGNVTAAAMTPTHLPAEIEALFEKMAGTMLLLNSTNESETTLFLNSPQFDQSLFYGARITIREFSTAPKAFNVEIATSAAALTLLNSHKSALMAAFAKGDFNFSVERLETEIQETDRPLFHRKEAVSRDRGDRSQ